VVRLTTRPHIAPQRMTRDTFNSLIAERDHSWSVQPRGLLRETLTWVILGYIAIFAALSVCAIVFAIGLYIALKFQGPGGTFIAGALALAGSLASVLILGCLWVRFDPPEGVVLEEDRHPDLHRLILDTAAATGGVRFRQVLLDAGLDVSAIQNPRLGVFGWYRTYLVIGLPLMEALTAEEFRAVLAHELAHVTGPDGRTRAWLHRTRITVEKIVGHMATSPFHPLLSKFFHWFWPRFNSRAFLLSRYNELEADRVSAQTVSAEALASGLRRLAIQGLRLDEQLWQPLEAAIPGSGVLPTDVMERGSALIRTAPDPATEERWEAQVFARTAELAHLPLGLAERLTRLGHSKVSTGSLIPPRSAAADLLEEPFVVEVRARFSSAWLAAALAARKAGRGRSDAAADRRSVQEAWKRIAALSRLDGLEKIQPEVLALLECRPDHSGALFLRGCHLAEKGQAGSTVFLERAASDPTIAARAYETLARYHSRFGDPAETALLKQRAEHHEREMRAALIERGQVNHGDSFLPHDLGGTELELLREILAADPAVRRVWLGAKEVKYFPSWRHLVLVVEARWPAFKPVSERMQQQVLARIADRWDVDAYVQPLRYDEGTRPVLRAIRRQVADSEIYRRK
jgi:Zn-dependent protease with chaperone function